MSLHNIDAILKEHNDYFQILHQCSIISSIIYENDPIKSLNNDDYKYLNHGIKNMCVSKTIDDYDVKVTSGLEVKYAVCDCSDGEKKRIIIGFRGSHTIDDFLVDLKLNGKLNDCEGQFHSGIFRRSKMIPITFFLKKLIEEDYEIILTGHSLGGAIAALVTTQILLHGAVTKESAKKVLFIGFGCPLMSCQTFKNFIEKDYFYNFHFYVNDDDIVPRILALLSNVIHDNEEIQQNNNDIENCKEFLNLITAPFIGEINVYSILKELCAMIPRFLILILKLKIPNYKPFGAYLRLTTKSETNTFEVGISNYVNLNIVNWIEMFHSDIINKSNDIKFEIESMVKSVQNHFMRAYCIKLKPFFETYCKNAFRKSDNNKIWFFYESFFSIPEVKQWKYSDTIANLKKPASYNTRVVANETHCDIFLSIYCDNIEYLVASVLQLDNNEVFLPQKVVKAGESNGICYIFSVPNLILIRNGELIKKSIKCILISHMNQISMEIELRSFDPNGFSYREKNISTMSNDLLYVYASCYFYTLKKLEANIDDKMKHRIDMIQNLFRELDNVWKISGETNKYDPEILQDNLKQYFFLSSDEKKINSLFMALFDNFKLNFSSQFVKLEEYVTKSKNTKDLFLEILPTVYHLNLLQSQELKRTTYPEIFSFGGIIIPLLFVPGLNFAAVGAACGVSAVLFGVYRVANLYRLSRKLSQNYQSSLLSIMEAFGINPDSCINYFYAQEKAIYNACKEKQIDIMTDENILKDWNNIFAKRFAFLNLDEDSKLFAIKLFKTIRINYQIRDIIMKDYFIGIVGRKKCGKSTFVETIFGQNANASATIATTEITPFKIIDSVVAFDFPHFESNDNDHKLQFIFTRFILDYAFVVVDAKERGDTTETTKFITLINDTCDYRFTIIVNRADEYWRDVKNNKVTYASEKQLKELFDQFSIKIGFGGPNNRVALTCLNSNNVPLNDLDSLNETIIFRSEKLRNLVFDIIIRQIPKNMKNSNLIESLNRKRDELNNLKLKSEKMIKVKKSGKDFTIEVHLLTPNINCGASNHKDISSYEELINYYKTQFDFTNPVLKTENDNQQIYSYNDFFKNDVHTYVAFEGAN